MGFSQNVRWIGVQNDAEFKKLGHIDAAFALLNLGDRRLLLTPDFRQLHLRQRRGFSRHDQGIDNHRIGFRVNAAHGVALLTQS